MAFVADPCHKVTCAVESAFGEIEESSLIDVLHAEARSECD